ncbi:MAG: type II secretion system F family protein [Actinomycetia bacterium]|nr:type II secretion system F family protein [Actinomycetes bacterium]
MRFPQRRVATSASEWAAFLDTTSTEVRSGSSLIAALAHARARHPSVAARLASAEEYTNADPDRAVVVQSMAATLELGGPIAATLHHGAALLRERAAQRAEATAHSAQARLSAKVLTAVPLLFAAWSATTSDTFRHAMTSPTGIAAALAGLVSNAVGWWWMRRIVAKATP